MNEIEHQGTVAMGTPDPISRELLGKIVDEVFDGAIEDASVIEEIYAAIKKHETPPPQDHVVGDADEQAAVNLGAAVLARIEDPSVREIAIRNALTEATKVLAVIQKGALPVRASEQAKINTYKSMPQTNTHDVSLLGWTDINWDINSSVDVPCAWDAIAMSARRYRVRWVGGSYTLFINGNREGCYPTAATAKAAAQADHEQHRTPSPAQNLLGKKHTGMKVDYRGLLNSARRGLRREPGIAEMLRQLEEHMTELGQRWYTGDSAVVDELLQLYCIESDARAALAASEGSTDA